MNQADTSDRRSLLDTVLRLALVAALFLASMWVIMPFVMVLLWAVLLAVMLWPLHLWLRRRAFMSDARSATVIGLATIGLVAVPLVLLLNELAGFAQAMLALARSGKGLPALPEWLASLPLVGAKLASSWEASRSDIGQLMSQNSDWVKVAAGRIAGGLVSLLTTMLALALAALFLAYGEEAAGAARRICVRVTGDQARGTRIVALTTMTIRGVLQGVVGVAAIQAMLIGAGFLLIGVPFAGVLIVVAFALGLAQLPALILTIPAIAWAWSATDTTSAGIFTAWSLAAGFSDQILKPIMLGRGIDAPMPVILLGVIGGMISGGLLGLFIGPVILAVGYVLFAEWLGAASN